VGRIGAVLSAIRGRTQLGGGVESSIGDTTIDITDPGTYTVAGNLACQGGGLPVAVLTANTASGSVPLTVSFDGSTSTHSTCTTLAKYTLDFGDGSTIVNQAGPLFSHDYISPGDYLAQLSVTDSAGQVSTNTAQVPISVTAATPPLSSVVSRKMHGDTTYDVNLPLEGTRGIECRTGASAGDHQLVFTFVNDLVNADAITASITSGTGSVSSSAPGADPKEYLVNLTGVANQQNIIVTLTGVQDSAGNSGPVVSPQMGVLIGDVNGSGRVDAADVSSVRQQTLQSITSDNFRDDLNTSGRIDAADVSVARQQTLTSLP
jgi:PKD repeat protein